MSATTFITRNDDKKVIYEVDGSRFACDALTLTKDGITANVSLEELEEWCTDGDLCDVLDKETSTGTYEVYISY